MVQNEIPEILAPAGSFEALYAAVCAGADAVYLSGRKYGARRFAKNFDDEGLKSAIYFCHSRGVKVYVTLNTLIAEDEMEDAIKELLFYYSIGCDAILVQDLGLLKAASECMPKLCLHASTQMTINNTPGAVLACKMNLKRIVLARELSATEIQRIYKSSEDCSFELEVFVHGALCYCYSGQCLLSSLIGGRSGNRGMCAQPCRKKYTLMSGKPDNYGRMKSPAAVETIGEYLLSPRDLCLYDNLAEISGLGVKSLKIEGRMKSADYVALVVSVYKKALDEIKKGIWKPDDEEKIKLVFAFNRLFTGGYISGERDLKLMASDRPDNRGMFLGDVVSCDNDSKNARLKIKGPLEPQLGDGLSVRLKGRDKDDGFTLRPPFSVRNGYFNFKSPYPLEKGDLVYITKRQSVSAFAAAVAGCDGGIYEKIPVDVSLSFSGKIPVVKGTLTIKGKRFDITHKASFEMADAEKRPVKIADLQKIFEKTGGIQYSLKDFSADYEENLFAPMGLLNELRRDFFAAVEKKTAELYLPEKKDLMDAKDNAALFISGLKRYEKKPLINCSFSFYADTVESVAGALKAGCRRIYFEPDVCLNGEDSDSALSELLTSASAICREYDAKLIWKLPRITNDHYLDFALPFAGKLSEIGISGIMAGNPGAAYAIRKKYPDLKICGSVGLNIYNSLAVCRMSDLFSCVTLSQELSGAQVRNLLEKIPPGTGVETEYFVHGAAELMISENNLLKSSFTSEMAGDDFSRTDNLYAICDEKNHTFPLYTDSGGRTHIYNSAETCLADSLPELFTSGLNYLAIDGRRRGYDYAYSVVGLYLEASKLVLSDGLSAYSEIEKIKKRLQKISCGGITEGHFRRGV
ncbi:MAG: DUF3656 domain-containing protein [Methanomicrobiaceae archaeon]|nr:DUF3656 domain-containing protein [Methanomicrobiaceae archaeon]